MTKNLKQKSDLFCCSPSKDTNVSNIEFTQTFHYYDIFKVGHMKLIFRI